MSPVTIPGAGRNELSRSLRCFALCCATSPGQILAQSGRPTVQRLLHPGDARDVLARSNDLLWLLLELACASDGPRLENRGAQIDVDRHFFESLRAVLPPLSPRLGQDLSEARRTGFLVAGRSALSEEPGSAHELDTLSKLCAAELASVSYTSLAEWLRDSRHVNVLATLLSALLAIELSETFPGGEPALAPSVIEGLTELSRSVRAIDDLSRLEVRPQGENRNFPPADGAPADELGGQDLQFTMYRPRAIVPMKWAPLAVFAHNSSNAPDALPSAPPPQQKVREQFQILFGPTAQDMEERMEDAAQPLDYEARVSFVPEVADVEFSPSQYSFVWLGDLHRAEFQMRAARKLDGHVARGCMRILSGGLVLAELNLAIPVGRNAKASLPPTDLAGTARAYRRIFASYAHSDREIVDQIRQYAKAVGDEYLIDDAQLRSGEQWSAALERLIERADIFQLFWSRKSMFSELVRHEWEYALSLRRPGFVRPTYWEEPFPQRPEQGLPPDELRSLHFASIVVTRPPRGTLAGMSSLAAASAALLLVIRTGSLDEETTAASQLAEVAARLTSDQGNQIAVQGVIHEGPPRTSLDGPAPYPVPELGTDGIGSALLLIFGSWAVIAGRRRAPPSGGALSKR